MQDEPRANSASRQRLDQWLFHARIVRTRADAADLVKAGHVRVNGARCTAPSHPVRLDDVLTIALTARVRVVRVVGFAARRGDSHAARGLFTETNQPSPRA